MNTTTQTTVNLSTFSLCELASLIQKDWRPVNYAAKPYLDAMSSLFSVKDNYFANSGVSVVAYFLANASHWKGETARTIKAELKKRLKAAGR